VKAGEKKYPLTTVEEEAPVPVCLSAKTGGEGEGGYNTYQGGGG